MWDIGGTTTDNGKRNEVWYSVCLAAPRDQGAARSAWALSTPLVVEF